jgi:hypothetical protein
VDGEATPDQLMEIRPHLRNCTACRATVRELHETAAPMAALFPVALPAAAAEHKSSLFARAYEAIVGGLHDRAAAAVLKVQAATEVASTGKLAAIAASAAAIGGGAVVANGGAPAHHARGAQPRPVAQRAAAAVPRTAVAAATGRATAPVRAKPHARAARPPHREFKARTTPRSEFTSASTASAPQPPAASPVVYTASPEPSASSREFASEFGG